MIRRIAISFIALALPSCSAILPLGDEYTFGDDAGGRDGGSRDAGTHDSGTHDGGVDAGEVDAGPMCPIACADPRPYCDPDLLECVECVGAEDCDDGEPCTADRCSGTGVDRVCTHEPNGPCISDLEAGLHHTCARRVSGETLCWGWNFYGQLGIGTQGISASVSVPTVLPDIFPPGFRLIGAGHAHSCGALVTGADPQCWGRNMSGELGDGAAIPGTNRNRASTASLVNTVGSLVSLDGGDGFTCALSGTGVIECWGKDTEGQLGNGSDAGLPSSVPVPVALFTDAIELTVGGSHSCARRTGTPGVFCWGLNDAGALGNGMVGAGMFEPSPVQVLGLSDAAQISAGTQNMSCAVRSTGTVMCWGAGSLGDGLTTRSTVPVTVAGINDAIQVEVGGLHICVLHSTGSVSCWGGNSSGQLGDGTMAPSALPVPVAGLNDAVELAVGDSHTCVRRTTGAVACWGFNEYGQVGNGTNDNQSTPVEVIPPL